MKKLTTVLTFLILHSSLLIGEALAQTPVPGGGGFEGAPLDGFTTLLLAAGVGYGIHRMKKNGNPEKEIEK